ncbi:unnamed protein product [Leptidea sinapis]|uniref:Uncharacterized protein n=1 Tax=Leptidea sinapis TaxID=189913 RepID=A0A5E4R3N9_9NEOP|nr:unnamed protein product [Leptidea sinapis]
MSIGRKELYLWTRKPQGLWCFRTPDTVGTGRWLRLEGHEFVCNHLAPKLKGRPRGRRRTRARSRDRDVDADRDSRSNA